MCVVVLCVCVILVVVGGGFGLLHVLYTKQVVFYTVEVHVLEPLRLEVLLHAYLF